MYVLGFKPNQAREEDKNDNECCQDAAENLVDNIELLVIFGYEIEANQKNNHYQTKNRTDLGNPSSGVVSYASLFDKLSNKWL